LIVILLRISTFHV